MVFPKLVITIVLALVFFIFIDESEGASYSSSSHIGGHGAHITSFDDKKVNLSVYYGSISQSSAIFIIKDLGKIFNNGLISIVNLKLVPWANAYVNYANNSITCQNGPDECKLNSLESCAINLLPIVDMHYELIHCLELMAIEGSIKNWLEDCVDPSGLPKEHVLNCFNGGNGTELGKKCINETAQLHPPPSFVPWVVVNDHPIGKDYANYTSYVCKAYKGNAVPAACNHHLKKMQVRKINSTFQQCHVC